MVKSFYIERIEKFNNELKGKKEFIVRNYLTPLRQKQLKEGTLSMEDAYKMAIKSFDKKCKDLAKVEEICNAKKPNKIEVNVVFKKSKMWGYNPYVTMYVTYEDKSQDKFCDSASGCGYDKESSATAGCFNACNGLLKMVAEHYANGGEKLPYGVKNLESNGKFLTFDGGVGYDCHNSVLKALGFKCNVYNTRGEGFNYYEYSL